MKQEENIRELAIQYFEGRISRADEKNLGERMDESPEYRFGDRCRMGSFEA